MSLILSVTSLGVWGMRGWKIARVKMLMSRVCGSLWNESFVNIQPQSFLMIS